MGIGGGGENKTYSDDQSACADILNISGLQGSLTVGTSAVEIKVGVSKLTGRKSVTLYNNSNRIMYWGYTNSVTTSTGTPIQVGQYFEWMIGDILELWVITDQTNKNTRITESA